MGTPPSHDSQAAAATAWIAEGGETTERIQDTDWLTVRYTWTDEVAELLATATPKPAAGELLRGIRATYRNASVETGD